jgi:predicted nucleic acid-binding protein
VELLGEITKDINVIIPEKVKTECLSKKGLDAVLISTLINEKKIEVKRTKDTSAVKKIQHDFRIDAGEAEALWLAIRLQCPIALDDGPTIKACKVMG